MATNSKTLEKITDPVEVVCLVIDCLYGLPEKYDNDFISQQEIAEHLVTCNKDISDTLLQEVIFKLFDGGLLFRMTPPSEKVSLRWKFSKFRGLGAGNVS